MDVLIIGAGAAGLTAARDLERAGRSVCCLDARDRIGGRILTARDPLAGVPIEMGAEFVHGRPREIFDLLRSAGAVVCGVEGRGVGGDDTGPVIEDMKRLADESRDESLVDFLRRQSYSEKDKAAVLAHIEGFDAARGDRISVAALAQEERAADAIGGDGSFRVVNGYASLLSAMGGGAVRLHSIVESVNWSRGGATVHFRSALTGVREVIEARRVIVTVPLGVLQAGSIRFEPEPGEMLAAARALEFGDAYRVTLRFERPFWEDNPEFAGAGFIFSEQPCFLPGGPRCRSTSR